jgi:hypothetical protein
MNIKSGLATEEGVFQGVSGLLMPLQDPKTAGI